MNTYKVTAAFISVVRAAEINFIPIRLLARALMRTTATVTCSLVVLVCSGCTSKEAQKFVPDGAKLGLCPLHNMPTRTERVPVHYGLPAIPVGYLEARKASFPNTWRDIKGGCVPQSPTKAVVHFCPRCREEEAKWMSAHGG